MKRSTASLLFVKLTVTIGCLFILFRKINFEQIVIQLANVDRRWLVAAVVLMFVQLLLTGGRWHVISGLIGAPLRTMQAMRLTLIGQFFNQTLPSSVGGDAVRAWILVRYHRMPLALALKSVFSDRLSALIYLAGIAAVCLPFFLYVTPHSGPHAQVVVGVIDLVTALCFILLWLGADRIARYLSRFRPTRAVGALFTMLHQIVFAPMPSGALTLLLSCVVQALIVLSTYCIARAFAITLASDAIFLMPLLMLLSAIPLSFAGWGLREGVMVTGLGMTGVSATHAISISVCLGLAQLLIGVPGLFALFFERTHQARSDNA